MVIGGIPGADIAVPVCFRSKPLLLFRIELLPNFFGDIIVGLQSGTLFDVPDEIPEVVNHRIALRGRVPSGL